uniref:WAPL domain-containing protein n=1 Tax=Panagrolaimus sp. JU765 TaxID=591449 RepID=A0AC34PVY1_9BILA
MSSRKIPNIAPGELPPPTSENEKKVTLEVNVKTSMTRTSSIKSPVKYNCPGIEESDEELSDDEMIIEEDKPLQLPSPPTFAVPQLPVNAPDVKPSTAQQAVKRKSDLVGSTAQELTKDSNDPFSFKDEESKPLAKKQKAQFSVTARKGMNKDLIFSKKPNSMTYRHTWTDEVDDDAPLTSSTMSYKPRTIDVKPSTRLTKQPSAPELPNKPAATKLYRPPSFSINTKSRNTRQKCLESGEQEDFSQDLQYFLSTLNDPNAAENSKFLSLQSIVKKAVKIEFRNFLRRGNYLSRLFAGIFPLLNSPRICAATSVLLYFMARDRHAFPVDENYTVLLLPLLKTKAESSDKNFELAMKYFWSLIEEWAAATVEIINQQVNLAMTFETFNIPYLTLEGLAFVCMQKHNPVLQKALFGNGCLALVVQKVDKLTKKLMKQGEEAATLSIGELNRCMRILETSALYNKQNQTFLMTLNECSLLNSCSTLFQLFHKFASSNNQTFRNVVLDSLCVVGRVLMNLTHDNDLCCTKLGSLNNFIELCLLTITEISPRYAPKDKKFDIVLMACALIVNMTENSSNLRKKIVDLTINVYDPETKEVVKDRTLPALTKMFVAHESSARTVDEEFDKELEFDDMPEMEDEGVSSDGRLHRGDEYNEDDAFRAMQAAMSKVDAHMEDSVFASYLGLVLGCLIQRDTQNAVYVKSLMPNQSFTPLIEQLTRFKEFMEMAQRRTNGMKTLDRIVGSLKGYNAL